MKVLHSRQNGFFSVGIGLVLFAMFGAAGVGLNSINHDEERVATKQQLDASPTTAQVAGQNFKK